MTCTSWPRFSSEAASADLEGWGRAAAGSVDSYHRDRVLSRVMEIVFP